MSRLVGENGKVDEPVIESIVFKPAAWDVPGPVDVVATMSDGSTVTVFRYFADEVRFSTEELVGLSVDQARQIHHRRDVRWLQS